MTDASRSSEPAATRTFAWITAGTIVAVFLGLAVFQFIAIPSRARENLVTALGSKGQAIAGVVAHTIGPAVDFDDKATVEEVFRGVMQDPEVDFVTVVVDGKTYAHQARAGIEVDAHGNAMVSSVQHEVLPVAVPVVVGGQEQATLRLGLSTQRLAAESARDRQVAGAIGLTLAAIGLATAALATVFLRRAQQVTQLAAARTRAELIAAAKDEFMATMSHEIRTPLNAVMGMTQNLLDTQLEPRQARYCRSILDAGDSLLALLNQHLDLAKIDARSFALELRPLDVCATVENVASRYSALADRKGLDLVSDVGPDIPRTVVADAMRLEQMLGNLLGNALKFTKQGEIVVTVRIVSPVESNARLRFEVRDTGIGIDEAGCSRLFQPFSQASDATAREYGGTGLGLSLVQRLAELMGGRAGVNSTVGVGSTFWFEIEAELAPEMDDPRHVDASMVYVSPSASRRAGMASRFAGWRARASVIEASQATRTAQELGGRTGTIMVVIDAECLAGPEAEATRSLARRARGAPVVVLGPGSAPRSESALPDAASLDRPVRSSMLLALLRGETVEDARSRSLTPQVTSTHQDTILVVEDNSLNQEVMSVMLRGLGFGVRVVDDGPTAIALIEQGESFRAILMDGQMPGMSGFEASREIRALEAERGLRRTRIIACTAGEPDRVLERAEAAGMDDVLSKPVLKPSLARVLARRDPAPAPPPGDAPGDEILDASVVAELEQLRADDGSPLFPALVRLYREKLEAGLQELGVLVNERSAPAAAAVAHRLMGSSQQLGARRMAGWLRRLERACADSDLDAAAKQLAGAQAARTATLDALAREA